MKVYPVPMRRFFVPPADLNGSEVFLSKDLAHHLGTVLRASTGEEILLLDGSGTVCRCRIDRLTRQNGTALVLQRWQEEESAFPVRLLQGLPKGDKMDLILQKGTELGITRFTPVLAGRSIPAPPAGREEQRLLRWRRIVREAAQQCRRPRLPGIEVPVPLSQALGETHEELRLMLWEEENRPFGAALPERCPQNAAVLIGPEGGFSSSEADAAMAAGFIPVRLGSRILRSETAGFAVATILQFRYGDFAPGAGEPDSGARKLTGRVR
jgi:16S rRNA (uracil1498-N3)-methyltransferase